MAEIERTGRDLHGTGIANISYGQALGAAQQRTKVIYGTAVVFKKGAVSGGTAAFRPRRTVAADVSRLQGQDTECHTALPAAGTTPHCTLRQNLAQPPYLHINFIDELMIEPVDGLVDGRQVRLFHGNSPSSSAVAVCGTSGASATIRTRPAAINGFRHVEVKAGRHISGVLSRQRIEGGGESTIRSTTTSPWKTTADLRRSFPP